MKRFVSLLVCTILCFLMVSCTTESDLYGAWYVDVSGMRTAIQFSENDDGEDIFIWVVYNLENDTIESNDTGYYHIFGDTITLEYTTDTDPVELTFQLQDKVLMLSSETARLVLEKYELDG